MYAGDSVWSSDNKKRSDYSGTALLQRLRIFLFHERIFFSPLFCLAACYLHLNSSDWCRKREVVQRREGKKKPQRNIKHLQTDLPLNSFPKPTMLEFSGLIAPGALWKKKSPTISSFISTCFRSDITVKKTVRISVDQKKIDAVGTVLLGWIVKVSVRLRQGAGMRSRVERSDRGRRERKDEGRS